MNSYKLIGGNKFFNSFYKFDTNPVYYRDSLKNGNIVKAPFTEQKPESLTSFEAGYKGLVANDKLLIDIYGYAGQYTDFTGRITVAQSKSGNAIVKADADTGQLYSIPINSPAKVKTYEIGRAHV